MKRTFLILSILCLLFSCRNENKVYYNQSEVSEKYWTDLEYYYCSGQRKALLKDDFTELKHEYDGEMYEVFNSVFLEGYNDYKNGDIRIEYDSVLNKVFWTKSPWNDTIPWNIGISRWQDSVLFVYKPEYQNNRNFYKEGTKNNIPITVFD